MKHLFGYNKQQIIAHSNPNLCVGCVARCSIKRFDVQMAFDNTFSMVEVGPWTKLEAKFYCTAVKGIDHFAKSGTWNERESGMVKLALKRCQSGLVSAQTLLRGQLCKAHDHKLVTAAELNLMTVAIVPCYTLAESVSLNSNSPWGAKNGITQ